MSRHDVYLSLIDFCSPERANKRGPIVRSYDLAEDVTQQVFIELFASIGRYDVTRPFPPWLHRIAVSRSVDELRRRKNSNVPLEAVRDFQSPSTSPEHAAEESELRAAIRNAIGTLDAKYRAAVVLRYYRDVAR